VIGFCILSIVLMFSQVGLIGSVGEILAHAPVEQNLGISRPAAMQVDAMTLPDPIFRHWTHSREEDQGDIRVYRPTDYNFPPARGREGMEFRRDGQFVFYQIGATDVNQAVLGQWRLEDANRVTIQLPNQDAYQLTIMECSNSVLKVKP
jgi:hypothetical protein